MFMNRSAPAARARQSAMAPDQPLLAEQAASTVTRGQPAAGQPAATSPFLIVWRNIAYDSEQLFPFGHHACPPTSRSKLYPTMPGWALPSATSAFTVPGAVSNSLRAAVEESVSPSHSSEPMPSFASAGMARAQEGRSATGGDPTVPLSVVGPQRMRIELTMLV